MDCQTILNVEPLLWLLEDDPVNPGIRYFALRDLVGMPADSAEVATAQEAVMATGPVPAILAHQHPDGYWIKPGYLPKYNGTMWSIIFLAQLGAAGHDPRIRRACEQLFDYAVAEHGGLSADGRNSGLIHCLQGNLCAALIDFGYLDDERLQRALDWLARSITGEGIAPSTEKKAPVRYLRSGNSGPGFECSANNHLPCAWGAIKAMLALSKVPAAQWTLAMERAIQTGAEFLLSCDPATAEYPIRHRCPANSGGAHRPGLWFGSAPGQCARAIVGQTGRARTLAVGIHLQWQDLGRRRRKGQTKQVGDPARLARSQAGSRTLKQLAHYRWTTTRALTGPAPTVNACISNENLDEGEK